MQRQRQVVQVNAGVAPKRVLAAGSWLVPAAPGCSNQLRSAAGALATAVAPGLAGAGAFAGSLAAAAAREERQSKQSARNVVRLDMTRSPFERSALRAGTPGQPLQC